MGLPISTVSRYRPCVSPARVTANNPTHTALHGCLNSPRHMTVCLGIDVRTIYVRPGVRGNFRLYDSSSHLVTEQKLPDNLAQYEAVLSAGARYNHIPYLRAGSRYPAA